MGIFPYVSVVIPIMRDACVIDTLESLERQTYPKENFEVLIVNCCPNLNKDGILNEYERKMEIRIISMNANYHSNNLPEALNICIERAKGEILAFIDANSTVKNTWLQNLIRDFKNAKVGGSAGEIRYVDFGNCLSRLEDMYAVDTYHGFSISNISYRKEVLQKVNGFDVKLKSGADYDLYLRVLDLGYEVTFNPTATIYISSPENRSWWKFIKKECKLSMHNASFYRKRLITLYRRKGESLAWHQSISVMNNQINATLVFLLLLISPIFPVLLIPCVCLIFYYLIPRAWYLLRLRHEIKYADCKKLYLAMPLYLFLKFLLQGLGTFLGMLNLLTIILMTPLKKSKSSKKY